jgi:hypothetical protein
MEWLLIAVGGLFLLPLLGKVGLPGMSASPGYPNAAPGVNSGVAPGTVTLGGEPAPKGWAPSQAPKEALSLATTGIAATGAIGSAAAGGAGAFAGTAVGAAIPVIGIGIAAVGIVLGIIAKHHAAAVATEAKDLNAAVPQCVQHFILVIQAAIAGATVAQCKPLLDQGLADYYSGVKSIQKGNWPIQGNPSDFVQISQGVQGDPGGVGHWVTEPNFPKWQTGHPGTCNGPCVVGHIMDGFRLYCLQVCTIISQGQHGVAVLKQIPSHAGFSGHPEVRITF